MAVGAGLDAIQHHSRQRRHLMHLARRKDDGVTGDQPALDPSVVEQAASGDHVIDLVGAGMAMDR